MKGALTFAILALSSLAAAGAAQPPKIDRRGLLKAVMAGAQFPGIEVSVPRNSLSVRTL